MALVSASSSSTTAVAALPRNGQRASSSFLGGKMLLRQAEAARPSFAVRAAADPNRPIWFPGSTPPRGSTAAFPATSALIPGASDLTGEPAVERAGGAGALPVGDARRGGHLHPGFLTKIGILNTPFWYTAGEQQYFTDTTTLFIIELILIGWAEGRRWADIIKPGSVNTDPIFPSNKLTGTDVGYPGGLWFDPLGWGSGSPEKIRSCAPRRSERTPRHAFAVMGAWFQAEYTGTGPIDNLFAHLADPGHATIFQAFTPK
ncbi:unnamed protein product [Miscanthus lutarioriparius]|uniref:Chlorophyll a-b binding protein, chloroplastic n=1 Tax=Miscanthus lutarioriparius TaxID=422564 RepID=A0A811SRN2_9POAL|nr:unnamed protein product [Miscanthus lutarioriparius]